MCHTRFRKLRTTNDCRLERRFCWMNSVGFLHHQKQPARSETDRTCWWLCARFLIERMLLRRFILLTIHHLVLDHLEKLAFCDLDLRRVCKNRLWKVWKGLFCDYDDYVFFATRQGSLSLSLFISLHALHLSASAGSGGVYLAAGKHVCKAWIDCSGYNLLLNCLSMIGWLDTFFAVWIHRHRSSQASLVCAREKKALQGFGWASSILRQST